MTRGLLALRSPRRFLRALIVSVLSGVLLTGLISVAFSTKANAAAVDPTQTCATLGLAGDDVSGNSEGDHKVFVGDPATVVVANTNVLPEVVILTPDAEDANPQTATLGPWGSHTFHLPSPGSLQTPYYHSFGIKVAGVPYKDSTAAQMLGFVKSDLCQSQRILTAAQVAGTGVAPVSGTGSLSFKIHLSAEAPAISAPNPFIISYFQQAENGNADLANGIDGNVTVPPGAQDAVVTVPVTARPAGSPADSIQFLLTGNDNHVPSPVLFTGTITSASASVPIAIGQAPRGVLYPGERLNPGDQLTSPNGRYALVMQGDGNLLEYDEGTPVWTSNTAGHSGSDFEAQSDGNFVVYAPGHASVWASNTAGHAGSVLKIQDDRNIVIYAPGNVAVWESHTVG
jgi:hypothetical protein